jgi:predicted secreted protein
MISKIVMALFLLWPFGINAAEPVVFRLSLKPQAKYVLTMEVNQTRSQTVDDEKQSLGQEMLQVWDVNVTALQKNGNMDIELTYKRVKIDQDFGGQRIEYDSDSPPEVLDQSMKSLAVMPGTVIRAEMTPDGKVVSVDGVDAMIDKMIEAMNITDSQEKRAVLADLRKQWGTDAMKQSLEQITSFYPARPVSPGSSWTSDFDLTSGVPMHIVSTYNLQTRIGARDSIDVSSQISSDSATSSVTMGPLSMAYSINGSQSGTILVDEATGLPLSSRLDMHYEGTVAVSGVPDQESQTWPISADGSVTITFVRQ